MMLNNKEKKTLGVIGGMGPLASQLFYKMIIDQTDAKKDQDHLDMIILNHATMPDRTEAILSGQTEDLVQRLIADAKMLESNGVGHIAIPCNTSHVLIDKIQESVGIPIINMVNETVNHIANAFNCKDMKVGILATDGTINTGLYQRALENAGFSADVPSPEMQKLVMKIIYDGVKNGGDVDYSDFMKIQEEMVELDCQAVILACTELSCFHQTYELPPYYIDAMAILAEKSIIACGGKLKR